MTSQEIERIECAIRQIQTATDVDPWAAEIAVEAMKTQLSAEGTTSDLISRQAAIALANSLKDDLPDDERMVDAVMAHNEGIMEYQTKLSLLPSAHSEIEERTEEFAQNVPKEDLISRKAAIEAMSESLKRVFPEHRQIAEKCLKALPSAQPETPMQIGWICPVCGRGLSPLTSVCPCNNGKGWEITC